MSDIPNQSRELQAIEKSFAYKYASDAVCSECAWITLDEGRGSTWIDLDTAEMDLLEELRYLEARGLLLHRPTMDNLIQICDEDEPVGRATPMRHANERVEAAARTYRWLQDTLRGMVDEEAALLFASELAAGGIVFKVRCAPQDVGKLIGKQGHNVQALRTMLAARGKKDGVSYSLDIIDDNEKGTR